MGGEWITRFDMSEQNEQMENGVPISQRRAAGQGAPLGFGPHGCFRAFGQVALEDFRMHALMIGSTPGPNLIPLLVHNRSVPHAISGK